MDPEIPVLYTGAMLIIVPSFIFVSSGSATCL